MKNSLINLIGTILLSISQWLQIFVLARYIGIYEAGIFSLFLAILAPLTILTRFNFINIIPTYNDNDISSNEFLQFRNLFNILLIPLCILIMIFNDFNTYENICFVIFIILKFIENHEEIFYCYMIKNGDIKQFSKCKMFKAIISISLVVISMMVSQTLISLMLSILLAQIFSIFYANKISNFSYNYTLKPRKKFITKIFFLGIGVTIATILSSMVVTLPKYILQIKASTEELGVFSLLLFFSTLVNNFVITINQALLKEIVDIYNFHPKMLIKKISSIYLFFLLMCLIGICTCYFFGTEIVSFIYGDIFKNYWLEILLLSIFISINIIFKVNEMVMNVLNLFSTQFYIQVISLLILIIMMVFKSDSTREMFISMIISVFSAVFLQVCIIILFYNNRERKFQ